MIVYWQREPLITDPSICESTSDSSQNSPSLFLKDRFGSLRDLQIAFQITSWGIGTLLALTRKASR